MKKTRAKKPTKKTSKISVKDNGPPRLITPIPQKKNAGPAGLDKKKAPRWYLYMILVYNVIGLLLFFTFNQFDKTWFRISTALDFMIFIFWFMLNIFLIIKFRNEGYEAKAQAFPIYYVAIYVIVYFMSGVLAMCDVIVGIYASYWLIIFTAVLEVAYAEFLLRDLRITKRTGR